MNPKRVAWVAAIAVVVYGAAAVWAFNRFDIPPIRGALWLFIITAAAAQIGSTWFAGLLFRESIEEVGRNLSPWKAFIAALVGGGVARLIPAGGAITPVAMTWTVRDDTDAAAGPALRVTLLNYAGLLVMAGTGILLARPSSSAQVLGVGLTVLAPIVILLGLTLMFGSGRLASLNKRFPKFIRTRLENSVVNHPPRLESQIYIWIRLALETLALWLILTGFNIDLTAFQAAAVFASASLFGGLPGTPGGLGYAEFGLTVILGAYGVPAETAVVPILVYRMISFWLPAATGFLAGGTTFLTSEEAKTVEPSG